MQSITTAAADSIEMAKKVLAHIPVTIRPARQLKDEDEDKRPPLIVSIPRIIAEKANINLKDQMMMYTDGELIYLKKLPTDFTVVPS